MQKKYTLKQLIYKTLEHVLAEKSFEKAGIFFIEHLVVILNCSFAYFAQYDSQEKSVKVISCSGSPSDKNFKLLNKDISLKSSISLAIKSCNKKNILSQSVTLKDCTPHELTYIPLIENGRAFAVICLLLPSNKQNKIICDFQKIMPDLQKILSLAQDNELLGIIKKSILSDVKRKKGNIKYLSNYDQLTALPNKSSFLTHIKSVIKTKKYKKFAILFIDLASFYRFNDTMGHSVGDIILKNVAKRLVTCLTEEDSLARIQGNTFGILLHNISLQEAVAKKAEQIIKTLEVPLLINNIEICLNSYVGAVLYPADTEDAQKLLNYADMALFNAKKTKHNTYAFFSTEMNKETEDRLLIEQDMRQALQKQQFFVEYQPQLDLKTKRIIGFEALMRWQHPEKGLISPISFIPVAEDTGMIIPLTTYIMETAFAQVKKWNQLTGENLTMAVNLSPIQFDDPDIFQTINRLIKKTKVNPECIELEITESLLMKRIEKSAVLLKELSKIGMKIAIDDFGTGYSSLSYLAKLPLHKLKIDRSFIQPLLDEKQSEEIVKTIINLGHTFGLSVIAEGCENADQFQRLKKLNCDSIQGFYISRPLPLKEAEEIIYKYNKKAHK